MNKKHQLLVCIVIGTMLLSFSCSGTNKSFGKNKKATTDTVVQKVEEKQPEAPARPIKEIEEKLIPIKDVLPAPHPYFVIMGSFKIPENAKKFQDQLKKEGFRSEILLNEAGLYRVSVKSTDVIEEARAEIIRIRKGFPAYFDTWLLIQKK